VSKPPDRIHVRNTRSQPVKGEAGAPLAKRSQRFQVRRWRREGRSREKRTTCRNSIPESQSKSNPGQTRHRQSLRDVRASLDQPCLVGIPSITFCGCPSSSGSSF